MANKVTYSIVAIDKFSRAAKNIRTNVRGIGGAVRKTMPHVAKFGMKLKAMGQNIRGMLPTAILGGSIAAIGGLLLKSAANFEMAMNTVQALTSATGDEFELLKAKARDLGATTKYTASQAAEGMGILGKAGFKSLKILETIEPVLTLATGANLDLAQSADIVTGIMAGFQVKAKDLVKVNDILVQAFTNSKTDLTGLGEAFKYGGAVASSMGLSLEETTAIFAAMSKRNIEATMAGTALRGMMSRLANPSKEAIKIFKKLNISQKDLFKSPGNLKSIIDIIGVLEKKGMNASEALEVFGLRAGPAMVGLMQEGSRNIKSFVGLLNKAGGRAKTIADVQMRGLTGQIRSLTSAFEGLQIAIAEAGLLAWATNIVKKLTGVTREVSKFDKSTLKLMATLGIIAAALPPLIILIGLIATPIGLITTGIALLGAAIAAVIIKWESLSKIMRETMEKKFAGRAILFALEKTGLINSPGIEQRNELSPLKPQSQQSQFKGNLDITLKDKYKNVQSMQFSQAGLGDLDVGLSKVGV